ncbi:MAG TPA: Asp-tRNA(Asn)/Glu-tRNA(Gln) amidotransferase subunit GatC [Pirellulales bacterium]|jgi:aspartyl-tRNA(Asn)/glutamyl-tRNA(Gln) amidotransferase subunit C
MSLSRQEVEKVSLLGRLLLSPEELDRMTSQLGGIVAYIEQLGELDAEIAAKNVQPMAHAVELTNVFRADQVQPSLDRAAALANAPAHDNECYLVPAVLGE